MNQVSVLVTNDDGYKCIGYLSLIDKLKKDYQVVGVAPNTERSWIGKSISNREVSFQKHNLDGIEVFSVDGTPADCAQIGIYTLFPKKPDWLISGINIGENLGLGWIFSSGTVGAALEAAFQGVKAIAISYRFPLEERKGIDFNDSKNSYLYETASVVAKEAVDLIIANDVSEVDFYIVNIPYQVKTDSRLEVTKPYRGSYDQLYYKKGDKLEFKTKVPIYENMEPGTDLNAVGNGNIAITPIKVNLASKELLEKTKSKLESKS